MSRAIFKVRIGYPAIKWIPPIPIIDLNRDIHRLGKVAADFIFGFYVIQDLPRENSRSISAS